MNRNYEPCLFEVSDDWQKRWALIREFATKWYGVHFRSRESLMPLVRYEEEKLGFKLPPSFQEYIMFHACANHILPGVQELIYFPKLSTINFSRLCIDVFSTVDIEDLDKEDPPIQTYSLKDEYIPNDFLSGDCDELEALIRGSKNTNGSLSSYIFFNILFYSKHTRNSGGSFSVYIDNNKQFIPMMNNFFERKIVTGNKLIYEKQNMISLVHYTEYPKYPYYLNMSLWKPLDRKKIPDFIVQYIIDNRGLYSGLFSDILNERRENIKQKNSTKLINLVDDRNLKERDDNWDEIPF